MSSLLGLNKGEAKNALARVVFLNRLGEIRDRSFENQRYPASGLNLVVAAIILWNTVYQERTVQALRDTGKNIDERLLPYRSPLGWGAHQSNRRLHLAVEQAGRARQVPAATNAWRGLAYDFFRFES